MIYFVNLFLYFIIQLQMWLKNLETLTKIKLISIYLVVLKPNK